MFGGQCVAHRQTHRSHTHPVGNAPCASPQAGVAQAQTADRLHAGAMNGRAERPTRGALYTASMAAAHLVGGRCQFEERPPPGKVRRADLFEEGRNGLAVLPHLFAICNLPQLLSAGAATR